MLHQHDDRQLESEHRSLPCPIVCAQPTAVQLDDRTAEREPETEAEAGRLGGVEGLQQPFPSFRREPGALSVTLTTIDEPFCATASLTFLSGWPSTASTAFRSRLSVTSSISRRSVRIIGCRSGMIEVLNRLVVIRRGPEPVARPRLHDQESVCDRLGERFRRLGHLDERPPRIKPRRNLADEGLVRPLPHNLEFV